MISVAFVFICCGGSRGAHQPGRAFADQRTTCGVWFFPTLWVSSVELRSWSSAPRAFTCGAILSDSCFWLLETRSHYVSQAGLEADTLLPSLNSASSARCVYRHAVTKMGGHSQQSQFWDRQTVCLNNYIYLISCNGQTGLSFLKSCFTM